MTTIYCILVFNQVTDAKPALAANLITDLPTDLSYENIICQLKPHTQPYHNHPRTYTIELPEHCIHALSTKEKKLYLLVSASKIKKDKLRELFTTIAKATHPQHLHAILAQANTSAPTNAHHEKIATLKSEISEIKDIGQSNILKLMQRGEDLNQLNEKVGQLQESAKRFKEQAEKLKDRSQCHGLLFYAGFFSKWVVKHLPVGKAQPETKPHLKKN